MNYLLAVANPYDNVVTEVDPKAVQAIASPPLVVNVVTHGFDPSKGTSPSFLEPFQQIADDLVSLANNTPLQGEVKSYVPQWDSWDRWYRSDRCSLHV